MLFKPHCRITTLESWEDSGQHILEWKLAIFVVMKHTRVSCRDIDRIVPSFLLSFTTETTMTDGSEPRKQFNLLRYGTEDTPEYYIRRGTIPHSAADLLPRAINNRVRHGNEGSTSLAHIMMTAHKRLLSRGRIYSAHVASYPPGIHHEDMTSHHLNPSGS